MTLIKSILLLQIIILSLLQNVKEVHTSCPFHDLFAGNAAAPTPTTQPSGGDFCNLGPTTCEDSKYRTIDGSCNNLANPLFGMANYKFARLLPAKYSDGIHQPTGSLAGGSLPNARSISLSLFGERDVPDPDFTLMNMQWGQVVAADFSRVANGSTSSRFVGCCSSEFRYIERNPEICFNLDIPPEDRFNLQYGNECMDFIRTLTDKGTNCNYIGGPVEQLNAVTSYMDLSKLYGNTPSAISNFRTFQKGRLNVKQRNGYQYLMKNPMPTTSCEIDEKNGICYEGRDVRVNSSPGVTILETMFLREHNRLAGELEKLNPHWTDELLFQEARRILTAQYQHINYYELFPIFLGRENMLRNKLIYDVAEDCHVNDYDPNVDATTLNEFATAAFRHFHSQCEGRFDLMSESRNINSSVRLGDWFAAPQIIEQGDNFDLLSRGMGTQSQQLTDINIDVEIKHLLFARDQPFGLDLRSIDTHRGRDHGLASYNDLREYCGIKRANTWEDFLDLINPYSVEGLKAFYKSPEDVDLNVGGSLEDLVPGTLAGPTFLCILIEQVYRTRVGDRFFFENDNPKTGFTKEQLKEIRKSSAARIMCDNGNQIKTMQRNAFKTVSKTNPIVSCEELPKLDLSKWIDTLIDLK